MTQDNQQPPAPATPAPAKVPIYARTWFIVVFLLFCFPVGLILMWAKSPWGTGVKVGVTIVVCFFVIIAMNTDDKSTTTTPAPATTVAKSAPAPAVKAPAPPPKPTPPPLPAKQQAFTTAVESYFSPYRSAPNELKKSTLRTQRSGAIKKALGNSKAVSGWVGTLKKMSTNSEGKAFIEIKLDGSDVMVQCWNNGLSDIMDKTLIEQGSKMFTAIADLSKGDKVVFSGTFVKGDKDWVGEQSMTESGSMTDPEFTFRFSSVKRK